MRFHNLLKQNTETFRAVRLECQQFIEESNGNPLIKWCSAEYPDVHRVKVRKRKDTNKFDNAFNSAFSDICPSIRNRSIIVNDSAKYDTDQEFYLFPADGFKILYSPRIENSKTQLSSTYKDMNSSLPSEASEQMFSDVLQYSYKSDDLCSAILERVEIIVYNIPFFYVVRKNIDYKQLLEYIV